MPSNAWSPHRIAGAVAGAVLGVCTLAAAQDSIDWRDAASCVDRVCSIRGTIVDQKDDDPVIRLYFDASRREVYLTLIRGWFVTWPDYVGHAIVATGPVDQFQGATEMILRTPDSVAVLDAPFTPTAPEATATVAPTLTSTPPPTAVPTLAPTGVPTLVPATAPPAVAVPPPVATQQTEEVDQLRQRVKELEERVHQLEGAH